MDFFDALHLSIYRQPGKRGISINQLTYLKSTLLGIVQGLTEFLPISSSGHLVLIQHFFGLKDASGILILDVALHFGTLLAVVVVYRREVFQIAVELLGWILSGGRGGFKERPHALLGLMVGVATLPAVLVGLFLKSHIEELFISPRAAGFGLLITGFILWGSVFFSKKLVGQKDRATVKTACLIGVAQALAIFPGVSRSGSTIGMGLLNRFHQDFAAKFSFLMAIPAILGAVTLEIPGLSGLETVLIPRICVGIVAAGVTGFLAIHGLLKVIRHGKLHYFAYYCWLIGTLTLLIL